MENNRIEFDRDEQKEKYIEGIFDRLGIYYESKKDKRTEYMFLCEKKERDGILCGLICNFYKFKEIMRTFGKVEEKDGAFYALVGAMLALDSEEDTKKVFGAMESMDFINVDGFYNFCLPELQETWRGLAELTYRLFVQCSTAEEIYALSIFILGMGDTVGETIVFSSGKEIYTQADKADISVVPYFGEEEADIIVTLVSKHPSDVIITDPTGVSPKVLSVIRNLGE